MSSFSPGRIAGIAAGTLAILAIGVYGPLTLLGPLPAVAVQPVDEQADAAGAVSATLPELGASAVVVSPEGTAGDRVLSAGAEEPLPIGGSAKLVTTLVALDQVPLEAGEPGLDVAIAPADFAAYVDYGKQDIRVLQVSPGDTWTQRDVLRAVLLASSNNHADTLARFAFGSVEAYVNAANEWLSANGYDSVRVADATGLSGGNIGTASDMARLARAVATHPVTAGILAPGGAGPAGARTIPDVSAHLEADGVRGLSRSYTDDAWLCFLFTVEVGRENPTTLTGAFLQMPDYDTLDAAVRELIESLDAGTAPVEIIVAGTAFATVTAPWGQTAQAVAAVSQTQPAWDGTSGAVAVSIEPFSTAAAGDRIGRVTITTEGGDVSSPLELDRSIRDPGPLWRLTNPAPVIGALLDHAG